MPVEEASADRFRCTPPASAASQAPERRLSHAIWTATSEDDCPVSTVMLGPLKPKWCDTRFAIIARDTPVNAKWVVAKPCCCRTCA
ncbi:hypothetical protein Lesp02_07270 [Lentzea sp. NBRC 105346]|nr:hypothetical protein Lesp02_07270 [Lentzea sp. NBRC 105346]